ncbi:hypothetical protein N8I77_003193 [Diaporthe amygdali]|uniref:2EXR domain-containing protein n=1 Tax=Phomopsis amygdali TaxID=1214568 RepID=A0AAD9SJU2_PHOAM|nr:hypothetical protein N8I77_003193 [Diaporthe amygdali]
MSDESDSEEHYYSGSEEGDESHESDSDDANHGLLDLEASEASDEPASDSDQSSDYGSYVEDFPKFMQLPPEIREMVWNAFCPDLEAESRVFELHLQTIISPPGAVHLPLIVRGVVAGAHLEDQTAPMRTVMAVHRESRALGLKSAPHELSLSQGELVRYHEERDVLFVSWQQEVLMRGIALRFQELGISAQNLAFENDLILGCVDDLVDLVYLLPELRRLFLLEEQIDLDESNISPREYAWAGSHNVHKYRVDVEEEGEAGLMSPVSRIFCWPDLDNNREFAQQNICKSDENWWWAETTGECRRRLADPLADSRELNDSDFPDEEKTEAINRLQNIEVWPMIRFNFREGLRRLRQMEAWNRSWDEWPNDSEGSYDDTEDEYESDGIDDAPIDDSTSEEEEDDLLVHQFDQESGSAPDSSHLLDNTSEIEGLPPANFSSDEEDENRGEPGTNKSGSENESGSQTRAARPKRRVVQSDSDESATETEQSPRRSKRQRRAILAESDDDQEGSSDVEPVRGANRRTRALPADSEDEDGQDDDEAPRTSRAGRRRVRVNNIDSDDDDEEEEEVQQPSRGRKRRGRAVQVESDQEDEDGESDSQGGGAKTQDAGSSDEEDQDSSGEDDDDPPPPKRMSLADRLRMESRAARPRHFDDDDDSGADDATGDGYGYSDDQEDDVDESDSGMVMGMAEEYEGEDGGSEEEY